jgi:hypothetical protein
VIAKTAKILFVGLFGLFLLAGIIAKCGGPVQTQRYGSVVVPAAPPTSVAPTSSRFATATAKERAIFEAAWMDTTSGSNKRIARKHKVKPGDVDEIVGKYWDEWTRRLMANRDESLSRCGKQPQEGDVESQIGGDVRVIDCEAVEGPTADRCWKLACSVRGKNVYGVKVTNHIVVSGTARALTLVGP